MFAECTTVEELFAQTVGYGSSCWTNLSDAGEFMGEKAAAAALDATDRLAEILADAATAVQTRPSRGSSE